MYGRLASRIVRSGAFHGAIAAVSFFVVFRFVLPFPLLLALLLAVLVWVGVGLWMSGRRESKAKPKFVRTMQPTAAIAQMRIELDDIQRHASEISNAGRQPQADQVLTIREWGTKIVQALADDPAKQPAAEFILREYVGKVDRALDQYVRILPVDSAEADVARSSIEDALPQTVSGFEQMYHTLFEQDARSLSEESVDLLALPDLPSTLVANEKSPR